MASGRNSRLSLLHEDCINYGNIIVGPLKEYQTKLGAGKIVVTAETNKDLAEELMRLKHIYGSGDLSKFPEFQFKDE